MLAVAAVLKVDPQPAAVVRPDVGELGVALGFAGEPCRLLLLALDDRWEGLPAAALPLVALVVGSRLPAATDEMRWTLSDTTQKAELLRLLQLTALASSHGAPSERPAH